MKIKHQRLYCYSYWFIACGYALLYCVSIYIICRYEHASYKGHVSNEEAHVTREYGRCFIY